jgi:putative nucleotidyltransferase with HDIG domain
MPSREDAWQLVCEWTQSDSLRKHMLAVEAAVRAYARRLGGDEELWGITGLVHDLDYERYPDLDTGHPRFGVEELRKRGYPEEVIHAVLGHADFMGVPRETRLDKALFACDELAGFISACAYVRPEGISGMKPKSVKKKLKQPSFAAGVNRDDVYKGAEELEPETGMTFDEHLQFVIDALAERADELGLTGRQAEEPAKAD